MADYARRPEISMSQKCALARRCNVAADGSGHWILCAYCNTPGWVTLHPAGTFITFGGHRPAHEGIRTDMAIDHVVPLKAGGVHAVGNMVFACHPCNISKGARLLSEWKGRKR